MRKEGEEEREGLGGRVKRRHGGQRDHKILRVVCVEGCEEGPDHPGAVIHAGPSRHENVHGVCDDGPGEGGGGRLEVGLPALRRCSSRRVLGTPPR